MEGVREAFLEAGDYATRLLGLHEVAARWNEASALAELTVAGLAGHLLRATKTVITYLDRPQPDGDPISAAMYFVVLAPSPDVYAPVNRAIRKRAEDEAREGPTPFHRSAQTLMEQLHDRLATTPTARKVTVTGDLVLRIDDYLLTRVVELVVHSDDLLASVGAESSLRPPPVATAQALEVLLDIARLRHGDMAVVRAMARRERDAIKALRVL